MHCSLRQGREIQTRGVGTSTAQCIAVPMVSVPMVTDGLECAPSAALPPAASRSLRASAAAARAATSCLALDHGPSLHSCNIDRHFGCEAGLTAAPCEHTNVPSDSVQAQSEDACEPSQAGQQICTGSARVAAPPRHQRPRSPHGSHRRRRRPGSAQSVRLACIRAQGSHGLQVQVESEAHLILQLSHG